MAKYSILTPAAHLTSAIALAFAAVEIGYVCYARASDRVQGSGETKRQAGGKAAMVVRANSSGTLRPGNMDGVYRAIGMGKGGTVSNITIDGLEARVIRDCVRINGTNIVIRNIHCSMLPPPQRSMHELPEGLQIKSGKGILVERSSFSNFQMVLDQDAYWNGDGVAVERGVSSISFRDVRADNNTDAGFDVKSPVTMDNVSASGNCRNYRFWSDADLGTVRVGDVVRRGGSSQCVGIWVAGSLDQRRATIRIRNLVLAAAKPLIVIKVDKGAADIRVDHCVFQGTREVELVKMRSDLGSISIDPSCRVR